MNRLTTLQDLILDELVVLEPVERGVTLNGVVEAIVGMIEAATHDGPLRSADGTLVVHRADPELAAELLEEARVAEGWCEDMESPEVRRLADLLRRAAALVDGDPEEEPVTAPTFTCDLAHLADLSWRLNEEGRHDDADLIDRTGSATLIEDVGGLFDLLTTNADRLEGVLNEVSGGHDRTNNNPRE